MTAAPLPSRDDVRAVVQALEVCAECGKTRVVLNLPTPMRGWHAETRPEPVSPQTHCACPHGPVPNVDEYAIVFRRLGTRARIYLRPPHGGEEPLIAHTVVQPDKGFDFGARSKGAYNTAINVLALVAQPAEARRLHHEFVTDRIASIAKPGGQMLLGDVRRWMQMRSERLDLAQYVRAFLDGAIGDAGPFEQVDLAAQAIADDVARRLGRPLTAHHRAQLDVAVQSEWNRRHGGAE